MTKEAPDDYTVWLKLSPAYACDVVPDSGA